jgi:glycosyltransferase domain-containing protein
VDGLEKLSIVIPTFGRHDFVRRQIGYWSNSSATIHIMDGSPDPIGTKDLENLSTNIHYHHTNDDFFARMRVAAGLINTPFVAMLGDDDLFLTAGLQDSIRKLEAEPNLFGVVGRAVYFFFQRGKVLGNQTHSLSSNYPADVVDGIGRLNNLYHEGKIGGLAYGVYRSEGWRSAIRSTYGKTYSCAYVYDSFLRTMLTYLGEIKVSESLVWLCSGENPPIKNASSFNRKVDLIDWFDGVKYVEEVADYKVRLTAALFAEGKDSREAIESSVNYVVSTLESRYQVKAQQRTSMAKRIPVLVQRYVPQKIKDFGKDYLPLKLKKILDWQNFTLSEVLEQMKTRRIAYDNAEVGRVISLIKDFHK